jgi:hypothetical protein
VAAPSASAPLVITTFTPAAPPVSLTPDDQAAIRLAWRRFGPAALAHPLAAELLQLSVEQQEEITGILARQREAVASLVDRTGIKPHIDTGAAMRTLRNDTADRALHILTNSQRAAWQSATEAPLRPGESPI